MTTGFSSGKRPRRHRHHLLHLPTTKPSAVIKAGAEEKEQGEAPSGSIHRLCPFEKPPCSPKTQPPHHVNWGDNSSEAPLLKDQKQKELS